MLGVKEKRCNEASKTSLRTTPSTTPPFEHYAALNQEKPRLVCSLNYIKSNNRWIATGSTNVNNTICFVLECRHPSCIKESYNQNINSK